MYYKRELLCYMGSCIASHVMLKHYQQIVPLDMLDRQVMATHVKELIYHTPIIFLITISNCLV